MKPIAFVKFLSKYDTSAFFKVKNIAKNIFIFVSISGYFMHSSWVSRDLFLHVHPRMDPCTVKEIIHSSLEAVSSKPRIRHESSRESATKIKKFN